MGPFTSRRNVRGRRGRYGAQHLERYHRDHYQQLNDDGDAELLGRGCEIRLLVREPEHLGDRRTLYVDDHEGPEFGQFVALLLSVDAAIAKSVICGPSPSAPATRSLASSRRPHQGRKPNEPSARR
jgi:hypothetical protein